MNAAGGSAYDSIIEFKLCQSCATIQLGYPFFNFLYGNGPPGWQLIDYTRQP